MTIVSKVIVLADDIRLQSKHIPLKLAPIYWIFFCTATLTHIFNITKPKVIFCDGQDFDIMESVTRDFKPKIFTVTDHIDGVSKVQDLLEPTKTEHFYK